MPMSLTDYAGLQGAIQSFLNRADADTTAAIPGWIRLAEAKIFRDVRRKTVRTTIDISDEETDLPTDAAEVRSLYPMTGTPWADGPLGQTTPDELATIRALYNATQNRPVAYATIDGTLVVAPAPDQTYTLQITYFQKLVSLSDSNVTNDILTEAPDAYLYGALSHAGIYLRDQALLPEYRTNFQDAIDGLNEQRAQEEFGAGLKRVKLPRVMGP